MFAVRYIAKAKGEYINMGPVRTNANIKRYQHVINYYLREEF